MYFNPKKVKGLMAENNVNQADIAKLLGLSEVSTSKKLTGKREFKANEISALASYFKTSPNIFFTSNVDDLATRTSNKR